MTVEENQLSILMRRVADLENIIQNHLGIDAGQHTIHSPHPNVSASTVEYGAGAMRLDKNGIQIGIDEFIGGTA